MRTIIMIVMESGVLDTPCNIFLQDAICSTKEENLKRAGIMMRAGGGYLGARCGKALS